jgi:hypothetical protein
MLLEKILLNQQKMDGSMSVDFKALPAGSPGASAFTDLGSSEVKTTYSGEEFKNLLQKKHSFPPNITISGNLDFTNCAELIESLPNEFTIEGDLILSDSDFISISEGITVKGAVHMKDLMGQPLSQQSSQETFLIKTENKGTASS